MAYFGREKILRRDIGMAMIIGGQLGRWSSASVTGVGEVTPVVNEVVCMLSVLLVV